MTVLFPITDEYIEDCTDIVTIYTTLIITAVPSFKGAHIREVNYLDANKLSWEMIGYDWKIFRLRRYYMYYFSLELFTNILMLNKILPLLKQDQYC